jgi:predicted nucleotidyltransferase
MIAAIPITDIQTELAPFCRRWGIAHLALFGSVLRSDFNPNSDVDILVAFLPGRQPGWLDREQMVRDLQKLMGHRVDLVERCAIEESPNYIRRRHILETAQVIYES